jgi:ribonuclease G
MKKIAGDIEGSGVVLRVNPDIARALKEEESGVFREMQHVLGKPIAMKPDAHLHHEQFDLMAT